MSIPPKLILQINHDPLHTPLATSGFSVRTSIRGSGGRFTATTVRHGLPEVESPSLGRRRDGRIFVFHEYQFPCFGVDSSILGQMCRRKGRAHVGQCQNDRKAHQGNQEPFLRRQLLGLPVRLQHELVHGCIAQVTFVVGVQLSHGLFGIVEVAFVVTIVCFGDDAHLGRLRRRTIVLAALVSLLFVDGVHHADIPIFAVSTPNRLLLATARRGFRKDKDKDVGRASHAVFVLSFSLHWSVGEVSQLARRLVARFFLFADAGQNSNR